MHALSLSLSLSLSLTHTHTHAHTHTHTQKRAKPSSTRPAKLSKKQLESRERLEAMRMKLKEMKAAAANNKRAGIRETDSTDSTDSTEHVSV